MTNTTKLPIIHNQQQLYSLARDYVLNYEDAPDIFLDAYDIDEAALIVIRNTPQYKEAEESILAEVKTKGMVQVKAQSILLSHLMTLHNIIDSAANEAGDRIKAMELLSRLADALPKQNQQANTGLNVSINFGNSHPPKDDNIIEAING